MIDEENECQLVLELRRDEGVRYSPYNDSRGFMTVGVGHNMQASPLPDGWTFPLDDEEVDALLESDLMSVYSDLDNALPWWEDLNDVRQRALCNLCFNLGLPKLLGFKNTLAFMRQGNWPAAANGLLNSAWATQVGIGTAANPGRALRIANMVRNGQ